MKHLKWLAIILILALVALPVFAQRGGAPTLAYVNASGQLIVTRADGGTRWVVTNPGERLVESVPLTWSPDGDQLLYAVQSANGTTLRIATPSQQQSVAMTEVGGLVLGGAWTPNSRSVMVQLNNGLNLFDVRNGEATLIAPNATLAPGGNLSPDGAFAFYNANGTFELTAIPARTAPLVLGRSAANAEGAGLWSGQLPIVAYPTLSDSGTSTLNITHAGNSNTLALDSNSAVPVTPLAWLPGTNTLLYRSAMGIMALDASCLQRGCNNAVTPQTVLPISTTEVSVGAEGVLVYTRDGNAFIVDATCVRVGDCATNELPLAAITRGASPAAAGGVAAFTGADSAVYFVETTCVRSGACTPISTGVRGVVRGMAVDGSFLLVDAGNSAAIIGIDGTNVPLAGGASMIAWAGE